MTETRRESLISAAAELLDRGGPAAVTLRDVGHAAGVSHNAPYKHFADKDDLLAAVASRELRRQTVIAAGDGRSKPTPQAIMVAYVQWARQCPERFKLTFGRWKRDSPELAEAAAGARSILIEAIAKAQACADLPAGEPERMAVLVLALAHGAADLALAGHLSATGRGHADPEDLVADLFRYLKASVAAAR